MLLEIRRGRANNRTRMITEPIYLVGSGDHCDLVLGDPQFSTVHFYLLNRNGQTTLRCMGSHPEVTINGAPHQSNRVVVGDRIRTGPFEFLVRAA